MQQLQPMPLNRELLCDVIILIGQGSVGCVQQLLLVLRLLHLVNDYLWGLQCHLLHKVQVGVSAHHHSISTEPFIKDLHYDLQKQ